MEKVLSKVIVGSKRYAEKEISHYVKNGWTIVSKKEWFDGKISCTLEYVRVY